MSAARLRELGDYLISLSQAADPALYSAPAVPLLRQESRRGVDDLPRLVQLARWEYDLRQRRKQFLDADLFGEPAWDILLDLFIAWSEGLRISISSACIGSGVPPTTALRWLVVLEEKSLLVRTNDPKDRRRSWIQLSESGIDAMVDWLREKNLRKSNYLMPASYDNAL